MPQLRFTKMHGTGNDYIYVDQRHMPPVDPAVLARRLSPRHTSVGSDGLILVCRSTVAACRMEMYNADGSRAEMCGNGIRCVAKYAYEHGIARTNPMPIETDDGIKVLELDIRGDHVGSVSVDMGVPVLEGPRIPVAAEGRVIDHALEVEGAMFRVTCLSMGNPHCVVFRDDRDRTPIPGDLDSLPLTEIGPRFEQHPFFPGRVNTEFVDVIGRDELRMRVWERGSGETQACGTGACAVAVAGVLTGRTDREVLIHLRGGDLTVRWDDDDHVHLRGEAVEVFEGSVAI